MNTGLPIIAALTPDVAQVVPVGFTRIDSAFRAGLPHVVAIAPRWRALLTLPTGSARAWLDMAPGTEVTTGAPRLRFQRDNKTVAVVPLVLGPVFEVVADGASVPLTAFILGWSLHAGDLLGPGDYGSFLSLSVAVADRGTNAFGPLPPSDFLIRLLPPAEKTESRPGHRIDLRHARLRQVRLLRALETLR